MAQNPRGRWPLAIAVIVGLVTSVGLFVLLDGGGRSPGECVSLEVSSSTEKDKLLAAMAADYNAADREFDGRCAEVTVHGLTSGRGMEALSAGWAESGTTLPEPQAWMPSTSLWLSRLQARDRASVAVRLDNPSVMASPLVVAMPEDMAAQIRETTPDPGWSDILRLSTAPGGWAAAGRPEWGEFTLARDNPQVSSSGLGASLATFHAGTEANKLPLTGESIRDADVLKFVRGVESSVTRYGNDAALFVEELATEDRGGTPPISAIVMQEELAYLYNRGAANGDPALLDRGTRPNRPFSVIFPREGTLVFDHPFIVLASASEAQRDAAEDFRRFLAEDDQQALFRQAGFRAADAPDRPTPQIRDTLGVPEDRSLSVIPAPAPELVEAMVDAWGTTRRHARVLLVLDVSLSMGKLAAPDSVDAKISGKSRLDLLPDAIRRALELLSPEDEVGLWTFSSGRQERVPIGRLGDNSADLLKVIDGLSPGGGTDLYRTVDAAHAEMTSTLDSKRINAVVVLSDGGNHPPNPKAKQELLAKIDTANTEVPVPVFTISYGAEADPATMREIARATGTLSYDAVADPQNIDEVFASVFSHF